MNGGGTWKMSGGKILARYFLSNGANTIFDLSGGIIELSDVAGAQHFGVANNGKINISGSVVIDGTQATTAVQTGGTIDVSLTWTGTWTWATYSGDDWKNLITTNAAFTLDGEAIDAAKFDSNFQVTDNGQTLSLVPEPSLSWLLLLGMSGRLLVRRRRN
jgi:hypothetical protein